jgi:hypothetical protein
MDKRRQSSETTRQSLHPQPVFHSSREASPLQDIRRALGWHLFQAERAARTAPAR